MRAGELRHFVVIQRPTGTLSPTGGKIEGPPETIASGVPMSIDASDVRGMTHELIAAGGLQGMTAYIVRCRYREDVTMSAVLIEECCRQRRLEIVTLAPTERNEALEMLCVERLA